MIDDNEVFDFDIEIDQIDKFIYGFCEPKETAITIKNNSPLSNSSLGAMFNIRVVVNNGFRSNSIDFSECFGVQGIAENNTPILTTQLNDDDFIVELNTLFQDPDGPGGLSDLDGDGEFDDLGPNDSFNLSIGKIVQQSCYDQYAFREVFQQ